MSADNIDLRFENFDEEPVEVNQRLLIDKILARYSSEYAIYRELMQNSDDARSKGVQIIFENKDNKEEVTRIKFENDGLSFTDEDWQRLKKIAEGNPDPKKIGAFGVGFYSLFSTCDNPTVFSGGKAMIFGWRGNQLFVRRGPIDNYDKGLTTFLMDMKKPIEFPNVELFAKFLVNSLAYTENLIEISVRYNDTLVIKLSKRIQEPKLLCFNSELDTFSPAEMFQLTSADVKDVQMDVAIVSNFNLTQLISAAQSIAPPWKRVQYQKEELSIIFKVVSGELDVKISDEFSSEMDKKKPPLKTTIQIIFTNFYENNSSGDHNTPSTIKDLLSYPKQGKIYIGFPTDQTTGCCSHLAVRVIPTMERLSVDLATETLAKYNCEMLSLAGTLCRILYEDEINQIARLYNEKISTKTEDEEIKSIRESFEKQAAHALTYFTFTPSKPHEKIGEVIESQFFDCLKQNFSILSTKGVFPISDVRLPDPEMGKFIKGFPIVPEIILERCEQFFKKAKNSLNLIRVEFSRRFSRIK